MIIGLDLDDTITDAPQVFSVLSHALVAAGHEVHVITFRAADGRNATVAELEAFGIRYTHLHLPPERESDPPLWKARVAEQIGLEVMFEDSPEVLAALPRHIKRFWLADPEIFDLDVCIRALRQTF